jgi:hypothetical protein
VLLDAGADMEDYEGETPLQLAINDGHTAVERVLRQFQQRRATPQPLPAAQETGTRLSTLEASVGRLLAAAGLSDEQRGEHTCVVCIDATTDHAVIPCGHVCLCSTCGPRLARTRHARCPICREPVQSLQKLFYP